MSVKIRVYSDYVCPYCLLAKKPLDEAILNMDVEVEWMPFELRPYPAETLKPEGTYLQTVWAESVYPMAQQMGINIKLPKVSPQPYTHLAFEGYQYAKENGKAQQYNERILRAFFQEERDIADIDVLSNLADEVGLDKNEYRDSLESRKYRDVHLQALRHAVYEAGITAVPTITVNDRLLRGIHSTESIRKVIIEEIRSDAEKRGGEHP